MRRTRSSALPVSGSLARHFGASDLLKSALHLLAQVGLAGLSPRPTLKRNPWSETKNFWPPFLRLRRRPVCRPIRSRFSLSKQSIVISKGAGSTRCVEYHPGDVRRGWALLSSLPRRDRGRRRPPVRASRCNRRRRSRTRRRDSPPGCRQPRHPAARPPAPPLPAGASKCGADR